MKWLYKYPQAAFPYDDLVTTNARRTRQDFEYELIDTGVFDDDRYFDVVRRICQVVSGGMLHPDHRREPGPGDRDDSSAADPVVPQHVVLVARRGEAPPGGGERHQRRERRGGVAPGARRSMALLRWRAAAAVHRERHEYRAALRHAQREPLRQGRLSRVRRARENRRRQPGGGRHQGRRPLSPRGRCRPVGDGPALPHRCAAGHPSVRGLREDVRGQASRGGRVLPILHAGVRQRGRRAGHATGLRRPLLDEAVLLLRRQHVAPRARRASVRLAGVGLGQEPPLVPHVQRRRHLDAGQVGVPVVRRLGSRLSRGRAGGRRPGLRQASAQPDVEAAVSALQRSAARLRVELRRRQPAGACVGDALPIPHGAGDARRGGPRVPQARLRQAPHQLHVVGESQGPPGEERVRGGLPRPRQHRRLRPQRRAAHRRPPRAGRRHGVDGDVLPEHVRDRDRARGPRPQLRRPRVQVCRALPVDRRRHEQGGPRRHVGRGGRFLLRRPAPAGRQRPRASRSARSSGCCRSAPRPSSNRGSASACRGSSRRSRCASATFQSSLAVSTRLVRST